MADKANPQGTQGRQQQSQGSEQKPRPEKEQVHAHERPMDDPGRGHGDVLEDEISKDAGNRGGQRGS